MKLATIMLMKFIKTMLMIKLNLQNTTASLNKNLTRLEFKGGILWWICSKSSSKVAHSLDSALI